MQFEAAEEHLRAVAGVGRRRWPPEPTRHRRSARCAIVSGGRSAEAAADALASLAEELWPLDAERSLELGSELLMVAAAVPRLRGASARSSQRFREQARGHPGFEAVARIHTAQEQHLQGGPAPSRGR